MATIEAISIPYLYTEAEAVPVENILDINSPVVSEAFYGGKEFAIEVLVGTFQFAAGAPITAVNPSYTVGDKLVISLSEAAQLRLEATAQNDSFQITG
jgi:hypothetical protein